jgi:hypothetical protein
MMTGGLWVAPVAHSGIYSPGCSNRHAQERLRLLDCLWVYLGKGRSFAAHLHSTRTLWCLSSLEALRGAPYLGADRVIRFRQLIW